MTMPIQFDTAQYIKTLLDAGVPHAQAQAHAIAMTQALSQPVANDADLTLVEMRMRAMLDATLRERFRPVYVLLGVLAVMQAITMTKLFL